MDRVFGQHAVCLLLLASALALTLTLSYRTLS